MKPWEVNKTREKMRRLSGEKTVRIFFDLYRAAVKILKASLMNENPGLSRRQLKIKKERLMRTVGEL